MLGVTTSYAIGMVVRAAAGEASLKPRDRMQYPRIAAVATAMPAQRFTQAELLQLAGYRDDRRRGFFEASDIAGRHLYIDRERFRPDESVDELNDRFRRGALELAEQAARGALARAGWAPAELDFIATTTCTGRITPSLDAHLVARLGCRGGVQRVHVGDTGCASAVVALQQAWNHLCAFPDHKALVLAVEICSAAYFFDDRLESAVAHAIFADGAGAVALARNGEGPVVLAHRTLFRSEHLGAMGFEYPGGRPRVVLSKDVRRIGAGLMAEMAQALLGLQGLKREDVRHWVLHSAGRRVLDRARALLELDESALAPARAVLRDHGNMSSATILFVLERVLREDAPVPGDWGVMVGLGPGFAAEGALLRW
jgi:alkylresorcinol/alkylpyrone synthase